MRDRTNQHGEFQETPDRADFGNQLRRKGAMFRINDYVVESSLNAEFNNLGPEMIRDQDARRSRVVLIFRLRILAASI